MKKKSSMVKKLHIISLWYFYLHSKEFVQRQNKCSFVYTNFLMRDFMRVGNKVWLSFSDVLTSFLNDRYHAFRGQNSDILIKINVFVEPCFNEANFLQTLDQFWQFFYIGH